jgi:hypothetical protein
MKAIMKISVLLAGVCGYVLRQVQRLPFVAVIGICC